MANTLILSAVRDALLAWAMGEVTPSIAIWRDTNGTKPAKDFVELNLVGPTKQTVDDVLEIAGDDSVNLGGWRLFELTVQVFAQKKADGMQMASDLVASLDDPSVLDLLSAAGLSVGDIGQVLDITVPLENKLEQRMNFTVGIMAASNRVVDVEPIENADWTDNILI